MSYKYYLLDFSKLLVRDNGVIFEKYLKGKWVEDSDLIGICSGDIPYYSEISADKARELMKA